MAHRNRDIFDESEIWTAPVNMDLVLMSLASVAAGDAVAYSDHNLFKREAESEVKLTLDNI